MEDFDQASRVSKREMDLRHYLALFRGWAWLIILAAVVAGTTAFVISQQITPVFEATTMVLVNEAPGAQSSDYQSLLASERLTKTYAEMMTKYPILEEIIQSLNLSMTPDDLGEMIAVKPLANTQLIEIRVESTEPHSAALIANTLVEIFKSRVGEVQSDRYSQSKASLEAKMEEVEAEIEGFNALAASAESEAERVENYSRANQYRETYYALMELYENVWMSEAQTISSIVVVEPARVPSVPVRPKVWLTTALAGVVGALLASGVILVHDALDYTLRTPEDVWDQLSLPALGAIEAFSQEDDQPLVSMIHPRASSSEAFRALRENLRFATIDEPVHALLVTSPEPGEGKSTVAANLAVVFAQAGVDTLLVDCDLRRPILHTFFGLSNEDGLSSILLTDDSAVYTSDWHSPVENMRVMPSGKLPPNPAELLASKRIKTVLKNLQKEAKLVILDSPPIQVVTDAVSLAAQIDGVLLVIQPGATHVTAARQSLEQLRRAKARVLGVVLNPLDKRQAYYAYRYANKSRRVDYQKYFTEGEGALPSEEVNQSGG